MILFLSSSFLTRLNFAWKPEFTAFLLGDRKHFFFLPDALYEVEEVSPESINQFLKSYDPDERWQLLGFLSPGQLPPMPGYVLVTTNDIAQPLWWQASVYLTSAGSALKQMPVEIRVAGRQSWRT